MGVGILREIRAVQQSILVFHEEPAHLLDVAHRLVLHLAHARRHVDAGVRKTVEERGNAIHVVLEAAEMRAHETQLRMLRHEIVARPDLVFVARHLGMQVHVVLRMLLEVLAIVVRGHLVERQPAVVRLGLVSDQRESQPLDFVGDR